MGRSGRGHGYYSCVCVCTGKAGIKDSKDQFRALTAQDMEIPIQTCLMPLAIKTQNDSLLFVHELKQEMHADLKYVESLEKEIDELESDKAEFSNTYDVILQECVSKDVMCSYLMSLSYLDALDELQCLYLHKIVQLILFIVDSGCAKHMTGNLKLLCNFVEKFLGTVIGLPKLKYVKDQLCSSYELSKAKSSSFKSKAVPSSKGRLNFLHMDLCGPMRVASINRKKYILVIVDDYSRYIWTLFLHSKDETPEVLKQFLTMIQRNLQALVITVRTDRGTEFLNKTLNAFFKEEGIEHQTSTTSDYDNPDPVPQRQDVSSLADAHVPSQQELDLLFGSLNDEFFNAGSNPQDKQPSTNIQPTSAPSTPTYVHAEENNDYQAEGEQVPDDEFTNPFCTPVQEVAESSSHNIGNSNVPTFNQPQVFEYRWTKDHPLELGVSIGRKPDRTDLTCTGPKTDKTKS
nr:retrovirus-related Pol polyprotein from transposon TNT 1-94 [Tanacetum cinerariifolium]